MSPGKNRAKRNRRWIKSQKEIKRCIRLPGHQQKEKYKERKKRPCQSYPYLYKSNSVGDSPSFHHSTMDPCDSQENKTQDPSAWFWENYNKAMQWQNQHFVSFWKGRCAALEAENEYLHKCLSQLRIEKGRVPTECQSYTQAHISEEHESSSTVKPCSEEVHSNEVQFESPNEVDGDFEESEELIFEVNEDVLAFFETSVKHKLELKKQRDAELKQQEEDELKDHKSQCPKETMQQRREEMSRIYGSASSMILSMETAMQLSYDRFNDKHQPKLWPNIPFNL